MPLTHRVRADGGLLSSEPDGAPDADELFDFVRGLTRSCAEAATSRTVVDVSGMELDGLSAAAVRSAASMTSEAFAEGSTSRVAIVAPSDVGYGLARMYASLVDADSVLAFRERSAALDWLGVAPGPSDEGDCG